MKATVLIPTYNAGPFLDNLIPVLKELSKTGFEIFIVDSSSKDSTVPDLVAAGIKDIQIIPGEEFDHGGTRSKFGKLCNSEIVVYLSQDALPVHVESIRELVNTFDDESIGAAYGCQDPYDGTNHFGKHLRYFNYPEKMCIRSYHDKKEYGIKTAFLSNSFAAYRKEAMDEIGWFKSHLILGEDTYAGAKLLKAGYRLAYFPNAKVIHSHDYTVWQEFKRYFDIGVFHKMEYWILQEFGKPEGEGVRYIKSEFSYLNQNGLYYLLPEFLLRNMLKYIGYKAGIYYNFFPLFVVKKLSMHRRWWDKFK